MRECLGQAVPAAFSHSTAVHRDCFRIGGVSVQVAGDRHSDVTLVSSLVPFRVDTGLSDINIQIGWTEKVTPASRDPLFDSGSVWRLYEIGGGLQFDFSTPTMGDAP